jgi:hypothetical protein
MLSFFLSNLSFYIVEGFSSRSRGKICCQAAAQGLLAEMALVVEKTA